jgi:hypothetical protein
MKLYYAPANDLTRVLRVVEATDDGVVAPASPASMMGCGHVVLVARTERNCDCAPPVFAFYGHMVLEGGDDYDYEWMMPNGAISCEAHFASTEFGEGAHVVTPMTAEDDATFRAEHPTIKMDPGAPRLFLVNSAEW